jgi:hemolysin activation/secretion protein
LKHTVKSAGLLLLLLSFFAGTAFAEEIVPMSPAIENTQASRGSSAAEEPTFEILDFRIVGNTIFPTIRLQNLLEELAGPGRTAADVEKARDILEKYHHEQGYPTVLVNIPEQSAESGVIKLQVIESRIGAATVKGNGYYSSRRILERLPSLASGTILYVPDVQREINRVNRTADLKILPAMNPGKVPGLVDVDLKAEEKLPLHGSLELSNRASNNTSELRLNAALHYDNLWDLDHSISFQYQTSPQKPSEVQVFSGSYILPAPWNKDNSLVLYGVSSNSDTAFGEGFKTQGKGSIIGSRYIYSLSPHGDYGHNAVAGFDYKNFGETVATPDSTTGEISTPVEYFPFSLAYNGSMPDSSGLTLLNAGLNMSYRGLVVRQQNLADKRFKAKGNYFAALLGLERRQKLPGGMGLTLKLDGQAADQPLISNEQFTAGGMESVRGYKESELSGDSAFHGMTELSAPDLASIFKGGERLQITPYAFYDFALLWINEPLPSQKRELSLQGTGIGVRGAFFRDLEFQVDWGFALSETSHNSYGDSRVHFKVKYQF